MAGFLGYLSVLADDISSLSGKTIATATKSLVTSLDDVGLLFDDIATYTKLASIKSSGLVVDDLAAIANFTNDTTSDILKNELKKAKTVDEFKHNIEKLDEKSQQKILDELEQIRQTAILEAKRKAALRELPIVYKIAIGSFKNKFIIIPAVLLMSYLVPWLISPILILGGIYLAYEGVESILEKRLDPTLVSRIAGPIGEYFIVTFAAQALVLPLLVYHFRNVTPLFIVANPLVLPAQPLTMILGLAALSAGLLQPVFGRLVAWIAWPFVAYTNRIVAVLARTAPAMWQFPPIDLFWVFVFFLLVFVMTINKKQRVKIK